MDNIKSDNLQAFEEGVVAALEEFNNQRQGASRSTATLPPRSRKATPPNPATPKTQLVSQKPSVRAAAKRRTRKVLAPKPVYLVKLAVRKRQLTMDNIFEYYSPKLSRLEAQIDAKKAAKQAGFPIFGHVYDIIQL